MKKRTITLMLSLLAVMLLVGVGFATWVISQGANANASGNVVVDTVKDNRLNVTVALKAGESASFNFGGPASGADQTGKWLTNDSANVEDKDMTFVITVTKKDGQAFDTSELPTLSFKVTEDLITAAGLVELDGLTVNASNAIAVTDANLSADSKTLTAEFTISYKWGNVFDNLNPFVFFNAKTVDGLISAQDATDANAAVLQYGSPLAAFDSAVNNYGDLAHAALEALYAQNTKTVAILVEVTL